MSPELKHLINTPEELRQQILTSIDWMLHDALGHNLLSEDFKRLLKAHRDYWSADDGTQLTRLLSFLEREP